MEKMNDLTQHTAVQPRVPFSCGTDLIGSSHVKGISIFGDTFQGRGHGESNRVEAGTPATQ